MELLEYGNAPGLILSSELSKKRFRTIAQLTKVGNVEICQVLKVDEDKEFIDLSLKRVSEAEKHECKENFSKAKLTYQIMTKACKISNSSIKEMYENWAYKKETEYGSLFLYFAAAKNDLSILDNEPIGEYFKKIIEEQFKASSFKVRSDVDITCHKNGVIGIKEAFGKALDFDSSLEITLLKSPTYSIVKICDNKEDAFDTVNKACELVKASIESMGGTFAIANPAKIYGEKSRHTMLENNAVEFDNEDDE
ncbi:Eukaryotic translation initiation factor 2 subunit 1 [Glugoides intestinalis]